MSKLRSHLLHPLESRGIAVADLPLHPSDGPGAFHVVATTPSGAKLYILFVLDEITIGFGERWHCHIDVGDVDDAVATIEELIAGASVVVEWFSMQGKYTGSGRVPTAAIPGRPRGDRFAVVSWNRPPTGDGLGRNDQPPT